MCKRGNSTLLKHASANLKSTFLSSGCSPLLGYKLGLGLVHASLSWSGSQLVKGRHHVILFFTHSKFAMLRRERGYLPIFRMIGGSILPHDDVEDANGW